jgi:hypothetical protein
MFGWRKRKELADIFARYVRPELVEAMKSPTFNPDLNNLSRARVNFIAVAVDGESPNEIGANLGKVAECARTGGWYADYLFSNLAVLIDGPPLSNASTQSTRVALLADLWEAHCSLTAGC